MSHTYLLHCRESGSIPSIFHYFGGEGRRRKDIGFFFVGVWVMEVVSFCRLKNK